MPHNPTTPRPAKATEVGSGTTVITRNSADGRPSGGHGTDEVSQVGSLSRIISRVGSRTTIGGEDSSQTVVQLGSGIVDVGSSDINR